jgi:DNA-binding transcriptional regulator YiaG
MGRAKNPPHDYADALVDIDTAALRTQFRALRAARGLSQADAAAVLHISQATVSAFEHGRHAAVRADTLLALHSLVVAWRKGRRGKTRAVLDRNRECDGQSCVWCGVRLPRMKHPARFCPCCGGHQSRVCECGARAFDGSAVYCARCGRRHVEVEPSTQAMRPARRKARRPDSGRGDGAKGRRRE